jgi:hypothetical protein
MANYFICILIESMPYVKVPVEELVVGQEYVLTHVGCESRMGKEAKYKHVENPTEYARKYTPTVVAPDCVRLEDIPPTSQGALEKAYKTWVGIRAETPGAVPYAWGRSRRGADVSRVGAESEYRKRAFYAGVNPNGAHIFTQERAFGSRKPVAFEPVDVMSTKNEKHYNYATKDYVEKAVPVYPFGVSVAAGGDWVVWKEAGGSNVNSTRRNNNRAAAPANVPTGNLLGLNNKPKMTNANANTKKARENWYKQHAQEQELAPLFPAKGGAKGKTRKSRRSRTY